MRPASWTRPGHRSPCAFFRPAMDRRGTCQTVVDRATPRGAGSIVTAPMLVALDFLDPKHLIETVRDDRAVPRSSSWSRASSRLPLPGDSLLFIAGFFARPTPGNDPHLNLAVVLVGAFIAAVVGAQIGYWIGQRYGRACSSPTPASSRRSISSGRTSSSNGGARRPSSSLGSSRSCARSCRCSRARAACRTARSAPPT